MSKVDRLQWWKDHPEGVLAVAATRHIVCGPLRVSAMVANVAKSLLHMRPDLLERMEVSSDYGSSNYSDSVKFSNIASDSDDEPLMPWDKSRDGQVRQTT